MKRADHRHSRKPRSRRAINQAAYRRRWDKGLRAYTVEAHEHDLAKAIQNRAEQMGLRPDDVDVSHAALKKRIEVMVEQFINEWLPERKCYR